MRLSTQLSVIAKQVERLEQTTFETPNSAAYKVITIALAMCEFRKGSYETFPNTVLWQRLCEAVDEYRSVTQAKGE